MNNFKITVGLLGIILTITGLIIFVFARNIKKNEFENSDRSKEARIAGYFVIGGLFLILLAAR